MRCIAPQVVARALVVAAVLGTNVAAANDPDSTFYRYRNDAGRMVYVNQLSHIPEEFRSKAIPIDLSGISINVELGNALRDETIREHGRLHGVCAKAHDVVGAGRLSYAWEHFGPLIAVGGAILLLFLISPFILKHVAGVVWARAIFMMVPTLAFVGTFAFVVVRTTKTMTRYREVARTCTDSPSQGGPIESHLQNLVDLQTAIERLREEAGGTTRSRGLAAEDVR